MSMHISINAKEDYLYVQVTGTYDLALALDLLEEVLIESVHHQLPRLLIDYRQLQKTFSMTDTYIYAASGAKLVQKYKDGHSQPLRIAYLAPESILADGEYGVEVAADYGFPEAKRTTNIDEALAWLGVRGTEE